MDADSLENLANVYERYAILEAKRFSGDILSARTGVQDAVAMFALADRLRGFANMQRLSQG